MLFLNERHIVSTLVFDIEKFVNKKSFFYIKTSAMINANKREIVNLSSHLNINNLLFGDSNLPDCENESNFLVIQDFIIKSKCFTPRI